MTAPSTLEEKPTHVKHIRNYTPINQDRPMPKKKNHYRIRSYINVSFSLDYIQRYRISFKFQTSPFSCAVFRNSLKQHFSTIFVFVGNRVFESQEFTNSCTWRYVPSHLNPADIVSRGTTAQELISSKWSSSGFLSLNPCSLRLLIVY